MDIIKTMIPEVVLLEPKVYHDDRGYFFEAFSEAVFSSLVTPVHFVQDNESRSSYGVVRVVKGRVLDVAVDLRRGSPTYGRHIAVELSEENHRMLFIPRGFAHGFSVLSSEAIFQYKCDSYYAPQSEGAVAWDDPTLAIDWRLPSQDIILSPKDARPPCLRDLDTPFIYE